MKTCHILLLCDDTDRASWIEGCSWPSNTILTRCPDPDEALAELKVRDVALMVLDLPTGKTSGWEELILRSRKFSEELGFVLLADRPEPEVLLAALRLGVLDMVIFGDGGSDFQKEAQKRFVNALNRVMGLRESMEILRELRGLVDEFVEHMVRVDQQYRDISARPQQAVQDSPQDDRRVLLVDDDENLLSQAKEALEATGFQVVCASSSKEAMDQAGKGDFTTVVLEQNLPDEKGLLLMPRLKEKLPEAEQIFVVGFTEADSAVEALRAGASTFMIKPYPMEDLVTRVSELSAQGELRRRSQKYFHDFRERYQGFLDKYQHLINKIQQYTG